MSAPHPQIDHDLSRCFLLGLGSMLCIEDLGRVQVLTECKYTNVVFVLMQTDVLA